MNVMLIRILREFTKNGGPRIGEFRAYFNLFIGRACFSNTPTNTDL